MDDNRSVRECILEALVEFAKKDPREKLGDNVQIDDFGLDSLAQFNFLISLEDLFDIEIPESKFTLEDLGSINSISRTISVVLKQDGKQD